MILEVDQKQDSQKAESLIKLGFRFGRNGVHSARTIMMDEATVLFDHLSVDASFDDYMRAVIEHNCLSKLTKKSRELTCRHLTELYALDPSVPVFRIFRQFWSKDVEARPVLALMMALARDALFRQSKNFILSKPLGAPIGRLEQEELIEKNNPDRYSPASLKSIAQNINGTWTRAGYLSGRNKKFRSSPVITPTNVAFCLFLGSLEGLTGQRLLNCGWVNVLQCQQDKLMSLISAAANRGLLVFMNAGGVVEIRFPGYLTSEEEELIHE